MVPWTIAVFEIDHDHLLGLQILVIDAARLDREDPGGGIGHTDVAKSEVNQAEARERNISLTALFLDISVIMHFTQNKVEALTINSKR